MSNAARQESLESEPDASEAQAAVRGANFSPDRAAARSLREGGFRAQHCRFTVIAPAAPSRPGRPLPEGD